MCVDVMLVVNKFFSFRNREHCEGLNYVINDSYD